MTKPTQRDRMIYDVRIGACDACKTENAVTYSVKPYPKSRLSHRPGSTLKYLCGTCHTKKTRLIYEKISDETERKKS